MKNAWRSNRVQFPRLLHEIGMIGLSRAQVRSLQESTDLETREIEALFKRASDAFSEIKEGIF